MKAIKKVRGYLIKHPHGETSRVLRALVEALGDERDFVLADMYRLEYEGFSLALALLREWRLDRHYAARLALFDVATMGVIPVAERRRKPR
jgi:hypothetical protein